MNRAAVVIGVEKTGGLPKLKAARDGAEKMFAWAQGNGFDAHLLTDAAAPVTVKAIKDKIREVVDRSNVGQLLVYFGGHGVNLRFSEYWLLSGAPEDGDEAVNVATSEALARRCGISHVVLLSDACRTAAEGIQAQSIDGSGIFPNVEPTGTEKAVDLFFATVLGSPALEIKDPKDSAMRYRAVYTEEVHAALSGTYPEYLLPDQANQSLVLRPRRLKRLLETKVPARVTDALGATVASQTPDARITSDDDAWLARFPAPILLDGGLRIGRTAAPPRGRTAAPPRRRTAAAPPLPESLPRATSEAVRMATAGTSSAVDAVDALRQAKVAGGEAVADAVLREAMPFGPTHFETNCGFKLQGAALRSAIAFGGRAELLDPTMARVDPPSPAVDVLLELDDGRGVLLPAIRDFVAALWFERGELRNVAYEPSDRSFRWQDFVHRREELSALRSLIASSAHVSGFRLDRDDAPQLTERIRVAKSIDPTMALYAAYSYHNLGRRDLIRNMAGYFKSDLGFTFFDVALLAGSKVPADALAIREARIFPLVPLLAQGWGLLDAFGGPQRATLATLKRHVRPSLWTVFDPPGVKHIRAALQG